MELADIDLTDEDVWADHVPHDQFTLPAPRGPRLPPSGQARRPRPIPDFWAVTRHADLTR